MRLMVTLAAGVALLSGCGGASDPLAVDPENAARAAATPPEMAAVISALEPLEGRELDEGLTLRQARADGGRLVLDLVADAAAIATSAERDAFRFSFERDFAQQMCAAPALRSFISERGGVTANVSAPDGSPILSRSIDDC
ncbi:hypothetical protein [Palleronia sp. LCG004]|uniref:hypothetical protein n=1 Tax=Palleronia sp. LCG004 TaxID=3079304 RepID=UPI002942F9BC|nr:hypothetical protein [Palleronia sp. LCG004]WOI57056.1 hypothetical protein RVY76_04510 [Palleronia sp. LCG004]